MRILSVLLVLVGLAAPVLGAPTPSYLLHSLVEDTPVPEDYEILQVEPFETPIIRSPYNAYSPYGNILRNPLRTNVWGSNPLLGETASPVVTTNMPIYEREGILGSSFEDEMMGVRPVINLGMGTRSHLTSGFGLDHFGQTQFDDEDSIKGFKNNDFEILGSFEEGEEGEGGMGGEDNLMGMGGLGLKNSLMNKYNLFGYGGSKLQNLQGLQGYGSNFENLMESSSSYESPLFGSNMFSGASSKKGRLPTVFLQGAPLTAPSVETKPVTSYIVREQPIKAPRTVIQPIIHQRLVEQPITKTRIITQPVIRRLITQPIIQPHVIQTTQVRQKIIDQPITVPKVTKQDIVRQVLVEQPMTNKAITRPTVFERRQPKVSTIFMGKQSPRALSQQEAFLAVHGGESKLNEELKFNQWQ